MFNRIIASILPYMPKKFVWLFSKRYVAGESIADAIVVSKQINEQGMLVTVDLLGEFISTIQEAEYNKNNYLEIVEQFTLAGINGSFSLKPTSFGLLIDKDLCYHYIREVVKKVAAANNFVRIDMEDSQCTSSEIELYLKLKEEFPENVGLVLQAYLKRTTNDIEEMLRNAHTETEPLNFRLCKGIYIESQTIAYRNFRKVREQFLKNLEYMLENGIYAAIATHDSYLVHESMALIDKYKADTSKYEFQMLYGVTPGLRDSIVQAGHKLRVYVPFGKQWFGYCSRRIKENPKMVSDIIKALFIRG